MKKVKISAFGTYSSKEGNWLRVTYVQDNFVITKFVEVLSLDGYEVGQEISVPSEALR